MKKNGEKEEEEKKTTWKKKKPNRYIQQAAYSYLSASQSDLGLKIIVLFLWSRRTSIPVNDDSLPLSLSLSFILPLLSHVHFYHKHKRTHQYGKNDQQRRRSNSHVFRRLVLN